MSKRTLRRLASVGWEESVDGRPNRIIRDDGVVLVDTSDPLVGTTEAAALTGVRPPNFVRDWATRPDFPAPAGTLSSGRVWRASEVVAYRDRRRPAAVPDDERIVAIARKVAWWDDAARTRARPELFIARVLAQGSAEDVIDIAAVFGQAALRRAVKKAPGSVLNARARHYWELVLGLPHTPPPSARSMP